MEDLRTLLEASLLDIDGTFEEGNKLENVNLTSIFESKTRSEFEMKFDVFRSMFENYSEVHDIKPRRKYIVFVENKSMTRKHDMCNLSIYFGTNTDNYLLSWIDFSTRSQMDIRRVETYGLDYFTEKSVYLDTRIYVCPRQFEKEFDKLIDKYERS